MKRCKRCGEEKPVSAFHARKDSKDGLAYNCKKCFQDWKKIRLEGSVEGRLRYLLHSIKSRKQEVSITLDYLISLFNSQNGLCALTGEVLTIERGGISASTRCRTTISLDRIDNAKGYVEGNVQFITNQANIAKNSFSQSEFFELCEKVIKTRKGLSC